MRGLSFGTLALGAFVFLASTVAHAADVVGKVQELTGSATLTHAKATTHQALQNGDAIAQQDVIETVDGARVVIIFADNTNFVMAGRGKLTIDDFIYDPKKPEDGKAAVSIIGAAFSFVGGLLDKTKTPHVTLNTDYGSIGIRGTSLYGAMAQGRSMIYLENGAVDVTNKGGTVALNPGFGTSLGSATEAPRAPYQWSAEEISWIKHEVSDPALHNALMAANDVNARAKAEMEPPGGGGGAVDALGGKADSNLAPAKTADMKAPAESAGATGQMAAAMPASPAAPAAASMPAAPPPVSAASAPAQPLARVKAKELKPLFTLASPLPDAIGTRLTKDPADKSALRVETVWPVTLNLAVVDVSKMQLEDTVLTYSAQMKTEHLLGPAYLEMWLHFPDQTRDVFVNGRAQPMTGDTGWKQMQTSYTLKKGQIPERITLNLVVNGKGVVLVKDVKLTR